MDPKTLLRPPSLLFPVLGGGLGYLVSESPWGAAVGVLAGALLNASAAALALESKLVEGSNVQLNDNSMSFAARSFLGQPIAKPVLNMIVPQQLGGFGD